jgi:hypothetical protein
MNCALIVGSSILLVATAVRSHEEVVHRSITKAASASTPGFHQFLVDLFGESAEIRQKSPHFGRFNAYGWLEEGSDLEDSDTHFGYNASMPRKDQQWRVLNHFYDPFSKLGLTDRADLWGVSSFKWAALKYGSRRPASPFKNDYSWTEAREYQKLALISQSKALRDQYFGLTFRSLGQVLHLNQDLTQPSHVRNDNHLLERELPDFIEAYGTRHANDGTIVYPQVLLDWRAAGYTSLQQFWDNLATYVNRNFISGDSKYKELHKVGKVHYYPLPSLQTGTDFPQMQNNLLYFLSKRETWTEENGETHSATFISKTGDGVLVPHHSGLSTPGFQGAIKGLNINNMHGAVGVQYAIVNNEYYALLIPEAIKYSAGVLDYFFRGRVETAWIWANEAEKSALRIVNKSGQELKGGTFNLFYDNDSGVRTEIPSPNLTTTYTGILADDDMIEAEFTTPTGPITSYTVVYKGTIGVSGTTALDPVDQDIAIAAKRITCVEGPGDPIQNDLLENLCPFAFASLTVQNFSELLPKLAPCATCSSGSTLPQWDGGIPKDPGVGPCENGGLQFLLANESYQPVASLGGSPVIAVLYPVFSQWELEISCYNAASQSWPVIWSGRKSKGYSPRGTYIVSALGLATDPGCDADTISCITLE